MNKPDLYRSSSKVTEYYSQKALQEFVSIFKSRSDGNDSWLDAGCGPANVTNDILLPMLPANFKRLVGVDISETMIAYARNAYAHPKVSYEQFNLDIELEQQSLNGIEAFDHITSFFCLMYVKNQKVCMENFNKLLKPGGDMLLVFLAKHPLYDAYEHLSKINRWNKYMKDVDQAITPYQHSKNPKEEFQNLLEICGFTECDVRMQDSLYAFENAEEVRDLFHSVSPFIDLIPTDEKEAFLDDMIEYFVQEGYVLVDEDRNTRGFEFPYKMIVAYGRKSVYSTED